MKEIILNVNGMMCEGCENRVKKTLLNVNGVESVIADHKTGTVTIKANNNVLDKEIKEILEDIGYEVLGD